MTHARTFTAAFLALSITGYSGAQTVRCTTWNLEWFPSGSAKEESAEQQNQRIKEAADVLRPINPEINPQIGFEFDAYPFSRHTCSAAQSNCRCDCYRRRKSISRIPSKAEGGRKRTTINKDRTAGIEPRCDF